MNFREKSFECKKIIALGYSLLLICIFLSKGQGSWVEENVPGNHGWLLLLPRLFHWL